MPLNPRRVRNWLAIAIALLLLIVIGFYARGLYTRYILTKTIKSKAEKLGIDIQQSTDSFSFSRSEGGRTIFTIRASKAVQVTSGRAELHDVNIIVYGRDGKRFDQIYGSDFEYDPKSGEVSARGEVHIDLQGAAQEQARPDLTPPKDLQNQIHLKTSGLSFNRNTGLARTDQKIEFRIPQASGSAVGATYDSNANRLELLSNIDFEGREKAAGKLTAHSATITKEPPKVEFNGAHLERGGSDISAKTISVFLRKDNTIERVTAAGDVLAEQKKGADISRAEAPQAEVLVSSKNRVQSAQMWGGVVLDSEGAQPGHGNAGRVQLYFGANNDLTKARLSENVKLVQPPPANRPNQQTMTVAAAALDIVQDASGQRRAETDGVAQVVLSSPANAKSPADTTITAERLVAYFDRKGQLNKVVGSPNAKVVAASPGQPDKITTSNSLTITMSPRGGLANIVQEGKFHYSEAAKKAGEIGADATAEKATYDPQTEMFVLSGSPRVSDAGATSTSERIRVSRRTGEAIAEGNVKTTYSQVQEQPNGALFAAQDPIHVTSSSMIARRETESALFSGGARLWQGPNIIEAPSIDFNRSSRTVTAQGIPSKKVSTVFVEQGQNGRQTPVNVTGLRLTYVDGQRQARFEGNVVLRSAEGTMNADRIVVYLRPRGADETPVAKGVSQLEKVVAEGNVVLQQEGRKGTGGRLTYLAKDGSFTLSGNSPSIFDAEHGQVTGDSLTFFSRDDRVLVEGSKSAQSVTKARVIK